jgi:hypothetical protein
MLNHCFGRVSWIRVKIGSQLTKKLCSASEIIGQGYQFIFLIFFFSHVIISEYQHLSHQKSQYLSFVEAVEEKEKFEYDRVTWENTNILRKYVTEVYRP